MSAVTIRHGHTIEGGRINFNEEPTTWEHADKLAGRRLDRRKSYCVIRGQVCELASWVTSCSGCFETEDGHPVGHYPMHPKHNCHVGSGCEECGYHGVSRSSMWLPIDGKDMPEWQDEEEIEQISIP
jgi:hypothetical protein